ncbi:phage tail tape measure protein [Archaeoglobales archaeon]|mgnify:CR=1 FL=1|nr:MAG: phage tail tape measure protein [Archaeoglobales archaeon]
MNYNLTSFSKITEGTQDYIYTFALIVFVFLVVFLIFLKDKKLRYIAGHFKVLFEYHEGEKLFRERIPYCIKEYTYCGFTLFLVIFAILYGIRTPSLSQEITIEPIPELRSVAIFSFAKVTGTDAVSAANSLSVAMKAFDIPATRMYEVTDTLIASQQRFGVQSAYIIELLKSNAAALKMLNLSFSEAVGLLSALEANGVNVARALMGLRSAAAKGIDVKRALRELAEIRDSTERTRKATEVFGAYAGPGLSKVLEGGTEALDKFMLKIDDIRGTTKKASETIDRSLSEQIGILKNNLAILSVEIGRVLLPVMKSVVKIVKTFADAFQALPGPIKGTIVMLVGLITVISAVVGPLLLHIAAFAWFYSTIANMGGLVGVLSTLKTAMLGFVGSVWAAIGPLLPLIAVIGAIVGVILLLQDIMVKGWEKSYLGKFVGWLFDKLPPLKSAIDTVRNAIDYLRSGFEWLSDTVANFIKTIQKTWKTIAENPIFKTIQTALAFTPAGMGIRAGTTLLTEHHLPSISELLPTPSLTAPTTTYHTTQTTYNQPITIHKIEVKADKPEQITKELVRKLRLRHLANPV